MRQALFACCGAAVGSFGSIALYDRWQASTINHPPQSSIDYGQIEQIVQSAVGAQRNSSSQEANIAWRPPKSKVTAENAVTTICLTGGPCGGKSSALDTLVRRLEEAKYQVFISPETPTVLKELCNCGYPYQSDVPRYSPYTMCLYVVIYDRHNEPTMQSVAVQTVCGYFVLMHLH